MPDIEKNLKDLESTLSMNSDSRYPTKHQTLAKPLEAYPSPCPNQHWPQAMQQTGSHPRHDHDPRHPAYQNIKKSVQTSNNELANEAMSYLCACARARASASSAASRMALQEFDLFSESVSKTRRQHGNWNNLSTKNRKEENLDSTLHTARIKKGYNERRKKEEL